MSHAAVTWAFKQSVTPGTAKFVLIALADLVGADRKCAPTIDHLAEMTCLDQGQIVDGIKRLRELGYLVEVGKRVAHPEPATVYRLVKYPAEA